MSRRALSYQYLYNVPASRKLPVLLFDLANREVKLVVFRNANAERRGAPALTVRVIARNHRINLQNSQPSHTKQFLTSLVCCARSCLVGYRLTSELIKITTPCLMHNLFTALPVCVYCF